jgi:predicted dehydrogenase
MKRAKRGPLRIGIAGLGFGLDVHLPAFRGIPDVEVVSLLGRDPVRVAAVAAQTGLPVATDLATWLKAPLDAVSLALPPAEIEAVALAALDRGLPILAEKPLGPDPAAAQRLASRAAGHTTAVDFELAELESFAALSEAIHAGTIGTIRHATVQWLTQSRAYRGDGWSWKTDAARGGGALTLFGTHVFYLLERLMAPVTWLSARLDSRASARLRPSPEAKPADDLANIIVEHRDGAATSIVIGNANPGAAIHRWTIVGDRGTAILASVTPAGGFHHRLEIVDPDGKGIRQVADAECEGDSRIAPFRRLAARFVEAVRSGGQCGPNFSDGLRVAHLVDATRPRRPATPWRSRPSKREGGIAE